MYQSVIKDFLLKKDDIFPVYDRGSISLELMYEMERNNIKLYSFGTNRFVFIKEKD